MTISNTQIPYQQPSVEKMVNEIKQDFPKPEIPVNLDEMKKKEQLKKEESVTNETLDVTNSTSSSQNNLFTNKTEDLNKILSKNSNTEGFKQQNTEEKSDLKKFQDLNNKKQQMSGFEEYFGNSLN